MYIYSPADVADDQHEPDLGQIARTTMSSEHFHM